MNAIEQHLLLSLKRLSFFRLSRHLLVLCLLSLAPAILSAATIDDLEFTLINNDTEYSVSAKDISTITGEVIIPATYNGKPVTAIGEFGFAARFTQDTPPNITSVVLPQTLTSIGDSAFIHVHSLTSINLSQTSVVTIGKEAMLGTSLTSIDFPETLTSIGGSAFISIPITSIDLSETAVNSIGPSAFGNCFALTSVNLSGTSITLIDSNVFSDCSALTSIQLPSTLTTIGGMAFRNCTALTSIDLSSTQVTTIKGIAFLNCSALTSIQFPKTLITLEDLVFEGCTTITNLDLSETQVTEISDFYVLKALESVILPSTVTFIKAAAFSNMKTLASITLLGSAPALGESVFDNVGAEVGGLVFYIKQEHEASYASWSRNVYTFNVIGDPTTGPVILVLQPSYDPTSKAFSMITKGEDSAVALVLQHTDNLGGTWVVVNTSDYTKATDANSGTSTRTVTIDPATQPRGFYRLISE